MHSNDCTLYLKTSDTHNIIVTIVIYSVVFIAIMCFIFLVSNSKLLLYYIHVPRSFRVSYIKVAIVV